ncbi:uncharacterized protein [Drosophila kikkawai]|uniref:Uncharacterized protein n=1 Tax=Drosophila kikkawai TaxID=30033 RepID=A0A6P4IMY9_DROKI|nr:uncharacterized protein LOC108075828 [Drosophila kikkawai]
MENSVDLVFTEAYLMPKKQYLLQGRVPLDFEVMGPPKIKINDIAEAATAVPPDVLDFTDLPDLNQPLPEVSIREQLRLTSVNRGKIVRWQLAHQAQLLAMWHSHSPGN